MEIELPGKRKLRISPFLADLIAGRRRIQDKSPSEHAWAIAQAFIRLYWLQFDADPSLADLEHVLSDTYSVQKRNGKTLTDWYQRMARELPQKTPWMGELAERYKSISPINFRPNRNPQTTARVLQAHYIIAFTTGREKYYASLRDLALISGAGVKTVSRHNKRLVSLGYLAEIGQHKKYRTKRYRLLHVYPQEQPDSPLALGHHDMFQRGACQPDAARTYDYLARMGDAMTGEIINSTGLTRMSVHNHLKRLEEFGLVEKAARGQWRITGKSLDQAAREYGLLGTKSTRDGRKRTQYDLQREGQRNNRKEYMTRARAIAQARIARQHHSLRMMRAKQNQERRETERKNGRQRTKAEIEADQAARYTKDYIVRGGHDTWSKPE